MSLQRRTFPALRRALPVTLMVTIACALSTPRSWAQNSNAFAVVGGNVQKRAKVGRGPARDAVVIGDDIGGEVQS